MADGAANTALTRSSEMLAGSIKPITGKLKRGAIRDVTFASIAAIIAAEGFWCV